MAQSTSLPQFSGRIGNMQFAIRDGKNIVHQAKDYGDRHRKRMKEPRMQPYRLNIREFAAASQIASGIYRDICRPESSTGETPGPIFMPYPHNYLTARIRAAGAHEAKARCRAKGSGTWFATQFTVSDIAHGLQNLDLSNSTAPTAAVRITALGPQHNPTHLKITGLKHAGATIKTQANATVECRIHLVQSRFQERIFDTEDNVWFEIEDRDENGKALPHLQEMSPSDWIPAEIIPSEGITIPIPETHANSKHITAVLIEWREHRTKGRRLVKLRDKGIVRIAAIHAPAEAWIDNPEQEQQPIVHHLLPAKTTLQAPKKPDWRKKPKEFLQQALTKIRPRFPIEAAASRRMPIEQLAGACPEPVEWGQRKR